MTPFELYALFGAPLLLLLLTAGVVYWITGWQDKRGESEHIPVQRPLQPRDTCAEITANRRQRHVDNRRFQQHHRLAQHRHHEHPAAGGRSEPHRARPSALIPHQLHPSWRSSLASVCLPSELTVSARAIAGGRARTWRVISVEEAGT